jgi:hypothetical protein
MSNSSDAFSKSILDAENLLRHFNALNSIPTPPENEVLKRAGLIMAMTAWETYVEDRVQESIGERLKSLKDSLVGSFMQSKLDEEIKRLHNPTYEKTVQLFKDYVGIDLSEKWFWNNYDSKKVKETLNTFMKLRGDVVHRSRPIAKETSNSHPVNKDDLKKVIGFLKQLVDATESALISNRAEK